MPAPHLLAVPLVLLLGLAPAMAEEPALPPPDDDEGFDLMEEGAKLLFRGLMSEMEPALDEMGRALDDIEPALRQMGPALRELAALMGDIENYEAPLRMPNGDILIRRKPGAPPVPNLPVPDLVPDSVPLNEGEIEL